MPTLTDRVAVVTGSTSGIGRGIARHFASLGAAVVIHGTNKAHGEALVADIRSAGGRAVFIGASLLDADDCLAIIREAAREFGRIDVLVNNAADISRGNVESVPLALWDRILAVNLRAPFILIQAAIPHMRARGGGSILNVGSVNAYIGEPKLCPYAVSKGGLMTLTKNAAAYLNQYRIRVNQLNVGWTLTEGEHRVKLLEGKGENWVEDAVRTRPFGRLLDPQDIAYAAAYFASDESACITGTVMDLEQYPVGAPPNW
ncbi:MAG TPA: oxidoreductase [Vicinamibacterales bacterium]|nr:oxidoreductase [Vicinamibacterales bacterium]